MPTIILQITFALFVKGEDLYCFIYFSKDVLYTICEVNKMPQNFNAAEYKALLSQADSIQCCPKVPLPQIGEDQNYIFISYSHKDYKKVYADLADMYEAGVRFWYDKGLSAGLDWQKEVESKLLDANCAGVIFFMSKDLFLSRSANREIKLVCNRTASGDAAVNYFSVNLSDGLPIQILIQTMQECPGALDMGMIGVLSQAFPDNATYLCYDSPDHAAELIEQIKNRFGVISDPENTVILSGDTTPCAVFIGNPYEKLSTPDRKETLQKLRTALSEKGISSYVMQDPGDGYLNEGLDGALKKHLEQQNARKIECAKCLLIPCCVLGFRICANLFGEFDANAEALKKVFYLVCSEGHDDTEEVFRSYYPYLYDDADCKDLLERIFFENEPDARLVLAIRDATAHQ